MYILNPSFSLFPDAQCMVYLPTFTSQNYPNVGKYTILEHDNSNVAFCTGASVIG